MPRLSRALEPLEQVAHAVKGGVEVALLGAALGGGDDQARLPMGEADAGLALVGVLAAGAAGVDVLDVAVPLEGGAVGGVTRHGLG